jgi:hypothetical protein
VPVSFAIPKSTIDDINHLPPGDSFLSTPRKTKILTNPILVLPAPWAPLFLCNDGLAMNANHAAIALLDFVPHLPDASARHIVSNFAWGLVTRRTNKASHAAVAVPIKIPRLQRDLAQWRNQQLVGIFESVDLSSDAALAGPQLVTLPPDIARLNPLEHTSVKDARPLGHGLKHTSVKDACDPVPTPMHTSVKDAHPSHPSVNAAPSPPPSLGNPSPPPDPASALLLATNQNLMLAMTAYFKGKAKPALDDDPLDLAAAPPIAKFTARRAAPFYAWAGIRPSHLFKSPPPLFADLTEASSIERHGIITGFFRQLERKNPRTFAGFQPSEDLIDDLSKFRLSPPQGYGTKWHRGVGPMAFGERSLTDIDNQTANRDLRLTYNDNLSMTMADARKLESARRFVRWHEQR